MKAVLVTHRFNPGHLSHILANKMLLEELKYKVCIRWNPLFDSFTNKQYINNKINIRQCLEFRKGDLFIIWFPSNAALFEALIMHILTKATVVYVYHEPYDSFTAYRNAGFSLVKTIKVALITKISHIISLLSSKVILPSDNAFNHIKGARSHPNKFAKINLMYDDETLFEKIQYDRKFISYIGTIAEDHAFDEFLNMVGHLIENNELMDFKFLIATRSIIPHKHQASIDLYIKTTRLDVVAGAPLSNILINRFYGSSMVVWNAYNRSMQSGVLAKAYMFGAPVLISERNDSEFFINYKTGIMISNNYDQNEMTEALKTISNKFDYYSSNCRQMFYDKFYYKSISKAFSDFVTRGEDA